MSEERRQRLLKAVQQGLRLTANEHGVCVNPNDEMTLQQHLGVLRRFREIIADGLPVITTDSTSRGDKYTECNWGLCAGSHSGQEAAEVCFPDPMLHTWPDTFAVDGRIAPIKRPEGLFCPMDLRNSSQDNPEIVKTGAPPNIGVRDAMAGLQGCYYTCRVFQRTNPTQEQAIRLYDLAIERINNHGSTGVEVRNQK